jgi:hypothetical protein
MLHRLAARSTRRADIRVEELLPLLREALNGAPR